jgi:hypothetical protein
VNHPYIGANSSWACCTLSWSRQRRAWLMAARSSPALTAISDNTNTDAATKARSCHTHRR